MSEKFDYNNLLFRELRMVAVEKCDDAILVDEGSYIITNPDILKALTLNENLKSLGYCFSPDSFPLLCHSKIDSLYEEIKGYVGEVKADPMYKGFPDEVMEMDEATFRFHQLLHYMSTYGIEFFTGCEVSKGWMPETKELNRDKSDTFKTDLKRIEVISIDEKYSKPASIILSRKTVLTVAGERLVSEAVKHLSFEQLKELEIPFKENIQFLFDSGMEEKDLRLLVVACKNPMDAFKCTKQTLSDNSWHLRTSQKRIIAKLFDTFDNQSFEENLMYSNTRREQIIRILDYIDYTTYSRNDSHKKSVSLLKDKKLKSWMSGVENLIALGPSRQVELMLRLQKRPGIFLRMCVRLLKLGYEESLIGNALVKVASKLSTQTLVDLLNYDYTRKKEEDEMDYYAWIDFREILRAVLFKKLQSIDTELKTKKIYLDTQNYDVDHSMILKSEEGGYNRGGMAFRIPEEANKVRFFVYWNDKRRVDIDLHANFTDTYGNFHHVGWNGEFSDLGVVTSGDITHSDAAEYIDFDLSDQDLDFATAHVSLYSGARSFADVDTCFVGLMGVSDLGQDVKLYDPKACFISQSLTSNTDELDYGIISIRDRYIRYMGMNASTSASDVISFSLKEYLELLFQAQGAVVADKKEDAEIEVSIAKSDGISLLDKNFFIDE